jgi:hypothetical protein
MLFDEPRMEDEMTDEQQEIWLAIRYLDPDKQDKEEPKAGNIAALVTVLALVLIALVGFVLLWVRGVLV